VAFYLLKLSQVNWDERIDRDEILKRGNMIKSHDLWQKEQHKKQKEEVARKHKELEEAWTAKRIYQLMSWTSQTIFGKKLVVNEGNKKLIVALCYFIKRDDRFESELEYNPQKGLLIRGATGLGKTYLVECVKDNPLNPILIQSVLDITEGIRKNGDYEINMGNKRLLYFDDVGTEEQVVKHYGTNLMFFKNFIESYYLKNKTFNRLIASTNLNFKQMESLYGFRVVSRMRDMFNVLDVDGKDMRG